MNKSNRLRDNVERWLIHENYAFEEIKNHDNNFKMLIKDSSTFSIPIQVFEPKKQPGILVFGAKFPLKNKQMARFLQLNEVEQSKFKNSVQEFCNSIQAINRMSNENGKLIIDVYLVLDNIEVYTQQILVDSIHKVTEMSEKTMHFIFKTF